MHSTGLVVIHVAFKGNLKKESTSGLMITTKMYFVHYAISSQENDETTTSGLILPSQSEKTDANLDGGAMTIPSFVCIFQKKTAYYATSHWLPDAFTQLKS